MLRILAIAPLRLTYAELARRQRRYHELGGESVRIDLTNLDIGAPERLEPMTTLPPPTKRSGK